jgi:hypothetical protein
MCAYGVPTENLGIVFVMGAACGLILHISPFLVLTAYIYSRNIKLI